MKREDAIWILELIRNRDARTDAEKDAVNAAIEALKAQLSREGATSDMIDRREAIDRFNVIRPVDPKKDEYTKGIDVGIAMCIVAVKDQPTIPPEVLACGNGELVAKPEPHWIPVSERVPEDYVDVLVWFEYFRYGDYNCLYQTHGIGTYVAEYNSWMINHESGWKDLRVIAWMTLPEPARLENV